VPPTAPEPPWPSALDPPLPPLSALEPPRGSLPPFEEPPRASVPPLAEAPPVSDVPPVAGWLPLPESPPVLGAAPLPPIPPVAPAESAPPLLGLAFGPGTRSKRSAGVSVVQVPSDRPAKTARPLESREAPERLDPSLAVVTGFRA
jgi:hypothetical protein